MRLRLRRLDTAARNVTLPRCEPTSRRQPRWFTASTRFAPRRASTCEPRSAAREPTRVGPAWKVFAPLTMKSARPFLPKCTARLQKCVMPYLVRIGLPRALVIRARVWPRCALPSPWCAAPPSLHVGALGLLAELRTWLPDCPLVSCPSPDCPLIWLSFL